MTKFFAVSKPAQPKYQDFVYEPGKGKAFFSPSPYDDSSPNITLVTTVDKLRLWYVAPSGEPSPPIEQFEFATNVTPLLKSHLQKSIRRMEMSAAVRTVYTMCLTSPSDVLRRLPIIAIEDVELIPGTSVIVWLMMTVAKRPLTEADLRLVIGYVESLVNTKTTFGHDRMGPDDAAKLTHEEIVKACSPFPDTSLLDEMLALYYRMTYGGMPGDIRMISRALEMYVDDAKQTAAAEPSDRRPVRQRSKLPVSLLAEGVVGLRPYGAADFPELMVPSATDADFVMASIDFHCYPWMLKKIAEKIGLSQARVKQLNWFCDSCVNERKDWTKRRAAQNAKTDDWKAIKPQLEGLRMFILRKIADQIYE